MIVQQKNVPTCQLGRSCFCLIMLSYRFEYLWLDQEHYRRPTRFPAKIYIDYLLNWLVSQLDNPNIFPVDESRRCVMSLTQTLLFPQITMTT